MEKKPGCQVSFLIKVLPEGVAAIKKAALKNVAKEVNIPGFRKGKAPESVIKEKFSSSIEKEFKDLAARLSLQEAFGLSRINPYSQSAKLSMTQFNWDGKEACDMTVEFCAYPEVPEIKIDQLEVQKEEPKEVSEEDLRVKLDELQIYHAEWQTVEARPAQEDDFVTLDVELLGEEPYTLHQDSRFHLKEAKVAKWLKNLVEGMQAGETREGTIDAEGQDVDLPSKQCKVTLKKIETALLPPLDDALAKRAGRETVEALKEAIKERLAKENAMSAVEKTRHRIKEQLLALYPFEMPAEKVEKLHEECHRITHTHHDDTAGHESQDHTQAHELFHSYKRNLQLSYMISRLVHDHNLVPPTLEKIRQRALQKAMWLHFTEQEPLTEELVESHLALSENELIAEQALDFLIAHAKVLDAPSKENV